jgi:phosphoribosylformylglycinamidine synthase
MSAKGENGCTVDLARIPLREEDMTPYEIMLSESQERMVFVIHPEDVGKLMEVFEKFELPAAVIGEVTDSGNLMVTESGDVLADIPATLLADPPIIERETCQVGEYSNKSYTPSFRKVEEKFLKKSLECEFSNLKDVELEEYRQ